MADAVMERLIAGAFLGALLCLMLDCAREVIEEIQELRRTWRDV